MRPEQKMQFNLFNGGQLINPAHEALRRPLPNTPRQIMFSQVRQPYDYHNLSSTFISPYINGYNGHHVRPMPYHQRTPPFSIPIQQSPSPFNFTSQGPTIILPMGLSQPSSIVNINPNFPQLSGPLAIEHIPIHSAPRTSILEEQKEDKEESLENLPESSICKKLFKGNSYNCRNIYKSILRNMHSYLKNNRDFNEKMLKDSGYTREKIEHAIIKVTYYNENERKRGNNKIAQSLINKILWKKTIYAYILRETLFAMVQYAEKGKLNKVAEKNSPTYIESCKKIYEETVKLLSQEAQGHGLII